MSLSEALQVTVSGAGPRTIVLSHGFGSDQSVWAPVRAALDTHYRVVSYNLAGAGSQGAKTYDPDVHHHVFAYADDLLTILEAQCADPVIYIGHSFSCMIGLVAASARPKAFNRLILLQGSPRYLNDTDYIGGFEPDQLQAIYAAMRQNFQSWASGFVPLLLGSADDDAIAQFTRHLFLMRPDIALNMLSMIFESDQRHILPEVKSPVHLIHSRSDLAVPLATAHWLHQQLPDSTIEILDLEGHLPHLTQPDLVIAALHRVLA